MSESNQICEESKVISCQDCPLEGYYEHTVCQKHCEAMTFADRYYKSGERGFINAFKEMVMVNAVIYQSDGFQEGYGCAISDLTELIGDYVKNNDFEVTADLMDILVGLGENLKERKEKALANIEQAEGKGYRSLLMLKSGGYAKPIYSTEEFKEALQQNVE